MFIYNDSSSPAIFDGERAVLSGFNLTAALDSGEKRLDFISLEQRQDADGLGDYREYARLYQDRAEQPEVVVKLKLRFYSRFVLAFVEGEIISENDFGNHRAFAPDNGITLKLGKPERIEGLLANYQHKDWWTRPHFDTDLKTLPSRTLSLLWRTDAAYYHLLPVCGPQYRTDLEGGKSDEEALSVRISSHQGGLTRCDTLAFIISSGDDPYELAENNTETALRQLGYPVLPRRRKAYPETLDYLGWCSWDAFYHQVDEEGLLAKASELHQSGLPVKWVMIDDGWSEIVDRQLQAFDADPVKFPQGLANTVTALKERYGINRVGVWHTIAGYWNGIHPESKLAAEYADYLFTTNRGNVIPYPDAAKGFGFWHAWHGYLKRQGVDFVKVDSQSAVNNFLRHHRPVGASAAAAHTALEASVSLHFDNTIINCMGMSSENIWHRPVSAVSRNSDDFVPQERNGFKEHALQNAYNSYFHGPFYWGDWDMFWTKNHDDVQNAVLRAISGGPVYFSDALGKTDPAKLWPLIYKDGRVIRCDRTANPTPDCLTAPPAAAPLKLWNTSAGAGIVAAFHIGEGTAAVKGTVSAADVPGLAAGPALLYDFFGRTVRTLQAEEKAEFELQEEQCKLYVLIPVTGGVTPIGLTDKYITSHAVREHRTTDGTTVVKLIEGGAFAFVSERKPSFVRVNGALALCEEKAGGFYEIDCGAIAGEITIEIVQA
ncbi:Sip1-related alpha-galactosidase [Paenibacillus harenae]|uniref:Sip1-related alpha-galactosidase n=1 Tax=Paenibacillus harenae TaxID=306543 RepID=UPI0003FB107C|nr:Sip1-related alpha-galactosidase [Paenibacillus harenae]